jgi:hypothetical protein
MLNNSIVNYYVLSLFAFNGLRYAAYQKQTLSQSCVEYTSQRGIGKYEPNFYKVGTTADPLFI